MWNKCTIKTVLFIFFWNFFTTKKLAPINNFYILLTDVKLS